MNEGNGRARGDVRNRIDQCGDGPRRGHGAFVHFYEALGFERLRGEGAEFTSYRVGDGYLNLACVEGDVAGWGRTILYVDDVDAMHARVVEAGYAPGSRRGCNVGRARFHVQDPDGHELSSRGRSPSHANRRLSPRWRTPE